MLQTLRCKHCGADFEGGRCMYCGSDEFVDVSDMYTAENVVLYVDVPVKGAREPDRRQTVTA